MNKKSKKLRKRIFDECRPNYKWIALGYCSDCGFGSCKHLQETSFLGTEISKK